MVAHNQDQDEYLLEVKNPGDLDHYISVFQKAMPRDFQVARFFLLVKCKPVRVVAAKRPIDDCSMLLAIAVVVFFRKLHGWTDRISNMTGADQSQRKRTVPGRLVLGW